jgi:hypothetical protein
MPLITGRRKIYVASSWRNLLQPAVVTALRQLGHEVYDFKNPAPGSNGFHWSEIDGGWKSWIGQKYLEALKHPIAEEGFKRDFDAMRWADTFVLVQPCGRSAHLEMGWACGVGLTTVMMLDKDSFEPELMVKMCDHVVIGLGAVLDLFEIFDG